MKRSLQLSAVSFQRDQIDVKAGRRGIGFL